MAKGIYIGVSGKARKVKKIYVGVNGKARKVKKVYVGINGKARLVWVLGATKVPTYSSVISGADKVLEQSACGSIGSYAFYAGGWSNQYEIEDNKWIAYNPSGTKYTGQFTNGGWALGMAYPHAVNNGQVICVLDWSAPAGWSTGFIYCMNSSLVATYPLATYNEVDAGAKGAATASVGGNIYRYGGSDLEIVNYETYETSGSEMSPTVMYKYDQSFTRSSITVPNANTYDYGVGYSGASFDGKYAILPGYTKSGYPSYSYSSSSNLTPQDSNKQKMLAVNASSTATLLTCPYVSPNQYYDGTYYRWESFSRLCGWNPSYVIFCGFVWQPTQNGYSNRKMITLNKSLTFGEVSLGYVPIGFRGATSSYDGEMINFGDFMVISSAYSATSESDADKRMVFVNPSLSVSTVATQSTGSGGRYTYEIQSAGADLTLVRMDGSLVRFARTNPTEYGPKCLVEFYKSSG